MNGNQFWAVIWKCATAAFVVVVATLGSCSVHKQRVVESMVERGADCPGCFASNARGQALPLSGAADEVQRRL